jgi:hypothetical protein
MAEYSAVANQSHGKPSILDQNAWQLSAEVAE